MPTYQYACTSHTCGHQFEQFQSFSDDALSECPECAGRLRKVFGSIGVVFKGSGFYRNDSREAAKSSVGSDKTPPDKAEKADTKAEKAEKSGTSDKPAPAVKSETAKSAAPAKSAPAPKAASSAAS